MGIRAQIDGRDVRLGRREWAQDPSHSSCAALAPPTEFGVSEVWLTAPEVCGRILLRDEIRAETDKLDWLFSTHTTSRSAAELLLFLHSGMMVAKGSARAATVKVGRRA